MKPYHKVYFEITNCCNRSCAFCPGTRRQPEFVAPAFFAGLAPQLAGLTDCVYFHVLGEPLLHPELPELLAIARQHRLPVKITTNGDLIAERGASLIEHRVTQVNFSLHERAADHEDCEAVFEFVRRAMREAPEMYLHFRLWNNAEAAEAAFNRELLELIRRNFGEFSLPANRASSRIAGRLYLHFDRRFRWPGPDEPAMPNSRCLGLLDQFAILVDGTVTICCLDAEGRASLGNVHDTGLAAILDSPAAHAIRDGFRRRIAVAELCRHCSYRTRFK